MTRYGSTCTLPALRDAAEIVAREIDEHHVLGVFLHVGEQIRFVLQVGGRIVGARPRAGDRPQLRFAVSHSP